MSATADDDEKEAALSASGWRIKPPEWEQHETGYLGYPYLIFWNSSKHCYRAHDYDGHVIADAPLDAAKAAYQKHHRRQVVAMIERVGG